MSATEATTSKVHLFLSPLVRRGRRRNDPAAAAGSTLHLRLASSGDRELSGQC